MNDEAQRPSEAFRRRLEEVRKRAGLTQTELAARCAESGEPSYRQTTVAKLERGDRGVALDDLFVLAYALGVPPAWLVTPPDARAGVAVTSGVRAQAWAVRGWIGGSPVLLSPEPGARPSVDHERMLFSVAPEEELALHRWSALAALVQMVDWLRDAALDGDTRQMRRRVDQLAREVDRLRDELSDDGSE